MVQFGLVSTPPHKILVTGLTAVNHGLNILGKGDLVLKDKQLEIIRYITLEKRDVMAVLPTGYGKSLVYQLIPPIIDFMEKRPSTAADIVLVFSPLIRDQVIKLRESGMKACILKGDRAKMKSQGIPVLPNPNVFHQVPVLSL